MDLAAEQTGDLTADREPQTGSPVPPVRRPVRLLERFEDQSQLVRLDPDPGVCDGERDHLRRSFQSVVGKPRVGGSGLDAHRDASCGRELECVRKQVVQDLLQALLVGRDRWRYPVTQLDV